MTLPCAAQYPHRGTTAGRSRFGLSWLRGGGGGISRINGASGAVELTKLHRIGTFYRAAEGCVVQVDIGSSCSIKPGQWNGNMRAQHCSRKLQMKAEPERLG
uniref:Uncharacterized protein n=1 Tax=Eutreptiella gymnastica TaxID=73025 RepID=A0A7S1IM07_9EUGL